MAVASTANELLLDIGAAAQELLRTVLATPVGAVAAAASRPPASSTAGLAAPSAADQQSFLEWLAQQRLELAATQRHMAARTAAGEIGNMTEDDETALIDRLEDAQRQLATKSRRLRALLQARDELATRFLREREAIHALEDQVDDVRQTNRSLRDENRALMAQIQARHEKTAAKQAQTPSSDAAQAAQQGLQRELVRNAILRNIFQLLIVGSGIDWSADDALRARLLSLGAAAGEE